MTMTLIPPERMMTPSQVAEAFGVDTKTVGRWSKSGRLHAIRTLGGHRRYDRAQVTKLLSNGEEGSTSASA
jgi:excisionase family DNA binding protein